MTVNASRDVAGTRILMLAPEPILRPRGTPLSVVARLRALSALGCRVDLVTYPFGAPLHLPGVEVHRSRHGVVRSEPPIGPSWSKIVLDVHLTAKAVTCLREREYDLIHAHEEAAFVGSVLARRWRLPHLYDMHSSLPAQMVAYGWFRPGGAAFLLARRMERWLLNRCDAVIGVYPYQVRAVRQAVPRVPVVLIENPPLAYALGLPDGEPVEPVPGRILYAGNLAANQGIDLLLAALPHVIERVPAARLDVIGGRPQAIRRARRVAERLGVVDRVTFRGIRPPAEVLAAHREASVLVSPRRGGSNVPSKVYTYLAVARPIVATEVPAHTQVLDDTCAILVPPTSEGLADGLIRALTGPALSARLAAAARHRLAEHFTPDTYLQRVAAAVALATRRLRRRSSDRPRPMGHRPGLDRLAR